MRGRGRERERESMVVFIVVLAPHTRLAFARTLVLEIIREQNSEIAELLNLIPRKREREQV